MVIIRCTHVLFSNKQYWREFVPSAFDQTHIDPQLFGLYNCDDERHLRMTKRTLELVQYRAECRCPRYAPIFFLA